MHPNLILRKAIRDHMKINGLSVFKLARLIRISPNALNSFINAKSKLSLHLWQKINVFLGTDVKYPYMNNKRLTARVDEDKLRRYNDILATLPDWINELSPEIKPYIEQEYLVSGEERAKYFADNAKTYEDIKTLRLQFIEPLKHQSSLELLKNV